MTSKLFAFTCLFTVFLSHPERALCATIHFDELPATLIPAGGLNLLGINFGFAEDSQIPPGAYQGATFGAPFAGVTSNLESPVLLGNDPGVLTLTFDTPTSQLSFDAAFALTTLNAYQVRLFNAAGFSLGTSNIVTNAPACVPSNINCANLSEASYSYSGAGIKTAALDFSSFVPGATPAPFALDNLTYTTTVSAVPEPSETLLIGGLGLLALVFGTKRRARSQTDLR